MIDERLEEQAASYAFESLEADEKASFESELAANPELAKLVDDLRSTAASLAHSAPARMLPPELETRILRTIQNEDRSQSSSGMPSWIPWALAAGLAICCGALLLGRAQNAQSVTSLQERIAASERQASGLATERDRVLGVAREQQQQTSAAQAEIARLNSERDALTRQVAELKQKEEALRVQNTTLAAKTQELGNKVTQLPQKSGLRDTQVLRLRSNMRSAPRASATVFWDAEKQEGMLYTVGVPPNGTDQDYQLWFVDPKFDKLVDGGVFSVGKDGAAEIVFHPKTPIASVKEFAVSLERKGGVSKPQGPIVLASK